ncbi:DUF2236 domain-containing protein [Flavipsychrobacter stenotrophus]|uniref:DUF2236 domain-containing protein n=1 Tax=Flavipsychrobacter stenotrophus TaxID=2077091 RepID=A0A2S7T038_9BACT|nr:oxygenase MpaB family protein [Flavipsychrobacter stenotrophus]PQJ12552.1 DUF2236 domain-containing protein [Flavipsychrobacter stenotrophus]
MNTKTFVGKGSIVRKMWGSGDIVMFIFAGAAAEFALNKAVDWLYFTGKLPADPLGRLFSTVSYAHRIIFASEDDALKAIDAITAIHTAVEDNRGSAIPDWAYRDVLYMLIQYSISAYELLERKLSPAEKEETHNVFYRMGIRMGLKELPVNYDSWLTDRIVHMKQDLAYSQYTPELFKQYEKHLGWLRYKIMIQVQALLIPGHCRRLLKMKGNDFFPVVVSAYGVLKKMHLQSLVRSAILPAAYKQQIAALDR